MDAVCMQGRVRTAFLRCADGKHTEYVRLVACSYSIHLNLLLVFLTQLHRRTSAPWHAHTSALR